MSFFRWLKYVFLLPLSTVYSLASYTDTPVASPKLGVCQPLATVRNTQTMNKYLIQYHLKKTLNCPFKPSSKEARTTPHEYWHFYMYCWLISETWWLTFSINFALKRYPESCDEDFSAPLPALPFLNSSWSSKVNCPSPRSMWKKNILQQLSRQDGRKERNYNYGF